MKNLISMTDFVLEQNKNESVNSMSFYKILRYANFLKQPIELWMFIHCKLVDGVWVVLEEPHPFKEGDCKEQNKLVTDIRFNEYQQAKETCIFKNNLLSLIEIKELITQYKTIEFLINYHYEKTGSYLETNKELF